METSIDIRNKLGGQASDLLDWIHLIEKNFSPLKKTPCRVRVEEIKPISGEPPAWKVIVFQILSESADLAIHTHEGIYGRSPSSLKDVLQRVFIQSCQEECYL
ncbi:unnamed protein product [Penicillium camemberti]|uniref:Str. FM013 n=1 Tax=Penicillium camemberti (strain FM 013) TaxID=1429867 RepID=A0A0G4P8B4_PENC3|nr:unnamed protein product [Penicillium camemberti]